jgi:hypothetical protein
MPFSSKTPDSPQTADIRRMPTFTESRMESPIQRDWPIQRFHSTLPANRTADIGCKEPGGGFCGLSLLKSPTTASFNAEAKGAQMLYRLTLNSRFRCLKHGLAPSP